MKQPTRCAPVLTHPITIAGVLTAIAILLHAAYGTPPPKPVNVNEVGPVLGAPDGH